MSGPHAARTHFLRAWLPGCPSCFFPKCFSVSTESCWNHFCTTLNVQTSCTDSKKLTIVRNVLRPCLVSFYLFLHNRLPGPHTPAYWFVACICFKGYYVCSNFDVSVASFSLSSFLYKTTCRGIMPGVENSGVYRLQTCTMLPQRFLRPYPFPGCSPFCKKLNVGASYPHVVNCCRYRFQDFTTCSQTVSPSLPKFPLVVLLYKINVRASWPRVVKCCVYRFLDFTTFQTVSLSVSSFVLPPCVYKAKCRSLIPPPPHWLFACIDSRILPFLQFSPPVPNVFVFVITFVQN